MFYLSEAQPET